MRIDVITGFPRLFTGPLTESMVRRAQDLKVAEINVETFKGAVQLSGFVGSQAAANKAVEVARGVGGVKSVKNDMRIK